MRLVLPSSLLKELFEGDRFGVAVFVCDIFLRFGRMLDELVDG